MPAYTAKKNLLISVLLLSGTLYARDIDVCLWRGANPEIVIEKFQKKYIDGPVCAMKHNGQYVIVSNMDLEDYIAGVLAKEMDAQWPLEALKAQAVVSRTFTVYTSGVNRAKGNPYDIENSIYNQVYGTTNCEKILKAVQETEGKVLTYGGKVMEVFFHANCGGATSCTSDVWGGNYPHISSVTDRYCEQTPNYKWSKSFTAGQLEGILGLPSVKDVEIKETDAAGRVTLLQVITKNGNIKSLTGHRFRLQVNNMARKILFDSPDVLPSTAFIVSKTGNVFHFEGKGYGHGVGMCQWGARIMAQEGFEYREILKHYFPEMEIEKR